MNTITGYLSESTLFTQLIDEEDDVLHDHTFVEIFYVTEGSARHICNGKTTELIQGTIGFLRPTDQHMYVREKGVVCAHRDILISIDRFQAYCDTLSPSLFNFFMSHHEPFLFQLMPEVLTKLEKDFDSYSVHPNFAIDGRIIPKDSLLISQITNLWVDYLVRDKHRNPAWYNTLVNRLSNPKYFYHSLAEIIESANIDYEHSSLSRMFKKLSGTSMISYFMNSKISHAQQLLAYTELPITEIANRSGFSSITYFNKTFKQLLGVTPTQYRNTARPKTART